MRQFGLALVMGALCNPAAAATMVFSDRTAFEAGSTLTASEDFEALGASLGVSAGGIASPGGVPITIGDFNFSRIGSSSTLVVRGPGQGYFNPSVSLATNSLADALVVSFNGPTTAFGLDIFSRSQSVIDAFDTSGNLVAREVLAADARGAFFGLYSDVSISRVVIDNVLDSGPDIDNLVSGTRNTAPVPLSASAWLLLSAVLGLFGATRRLRLG